MHNFMYKDLKEFAQSKSFRGILVGIGVAIIALLIFQAGMFVGYRKAAFAYRFGDNYYRAFDHRGSKAFRESFPGKFMDVNGAAGTIVSIDLPTFVVVGPDEVEKVILIGDKTRIRHFDQEVEPSNLKVDDFTVILGSPNESSQIEAKLIRVLPPPSDIEERTTKKP